MEIIFEYQHAGRSPAFYIGGSTCFDTLDSQSSSRCREVKDEARSPASVVQQSSQVAFTYACQYFCVRVVAHEILQYLEFGRAETYSRI